jgi:hypothetical protein
MFGPKERDELDLPRREEPVDDAAAARIDAGVIGDQADALASDDEGNVGEELLDTGPNVNARRGLSVD